MPINVQDGMTYTERNKQLLARWQQGEREVENDIIQNNLGLIRSIVRKHTRCSNDLEDLFQIGCLEMYRALFRYDAKKGSNFATFVQTTVIGSIRKYYRDKAALIRLPRPQWELKVAIIKFIVSYYEEHFKEPSITEISDHFQIEARVVSDILLSSKDIESLDAKLLEEENSSAYYNLNANSITQVNLTSPEDKIMIEAALMLLSEKERILVYQYYFEGYTQVELSQKYGIAQMTISRMLKKAILQMKQTLSGTA